MKLQLHLLILHAQVWQQAEGFVKIFNKINKVGSLEVAANRTFFPFYSSLINYLLETCLLKCICDYFPFILLASKRKKRYPTTQTNCVYLAVSKQKGTRRGRFTPSADEIGRRK